ncbi:MAG: 3-methyladenine DNA glycosylase [Chloroflexi bacterium]|nr:3-methyladenine DNA glycosylase [Chloroflexota bacterium]
MTRFILAPPLDFRFLATVLSHGWCVLHPFSYEEAGTISRVQKLSDGQIVRFEVRADANGLLISSEAKLSRKQQQEISAVVARCLSFDHNLAPFHDLIRAHPDYGWIETAGAGRMLVSPTVWEDLAKTLLTTNTTWAMTKSMVSRLVTLGDAMPDGEHAFPEPAQIAAFDSETLNQHVRAGYRGAYLHELAARIVSGDLDVEAWRDPALSSVEVYKALKRLKGFGDYAAGAMMRLLGRFDQLGLDSVCRTMYAQRYNAGIAATDREIAAFYEPFGDWRGLVVWMDVMREDILS